MYLGGSWVLIGRARNRVAMVRSLLQVLITLLLSINDPSGTGPLRVYGPLTLAPVEGLQHLGP